MFEQMKKMALSASAELLKRWQENHSIEIKQDLSPITDVDKFMSSFLTIELKKIENLPVVSEEDTSQYQNKNDRYWLIDPLDGTKDFIKGGTDFAINIALLDKTTPIFSCIIVPYFGKIFFAYLTHGAFLLHKNKMQKIILSKKIKPIALISKSHRNSLDYRFLSENAIKNTKKVGASLKFCSIAMGEASLYVRFDRLSSWDIAAGHLLVKEAGCQILDLITLKEPSYSEPLLRMNPFIVLSKNANFRKLKIPCLT